MRDPSGDHVGCASCWYPLVSRTRPLPFALTRYRLEGPFSYASPRWKTIRPFPPGNAPSPADVAPPNAVSASAATTTALMTISDLLVGVLRRTLRPPC